MTSRAFDLAALFAAADAERRARGLSWNALGRELGVAAATIRRLAEADDAEADGVLAVIRWLDAVPEDYVDGSVVEGARLPAAGAGFVRVDWDLLAAASGDERGAAGRTRTTIQILTATAQRSGRTIASLTRVSEV